MRYKKLQGKTIFSEWTFKEKPLLSHSNHISDVPWVIGKPQNAESLSQHRHEQPEVKFGNIFKSIFFFSTVRWIILNWLIYFFSSRNVYFTFVVFSGVPAQSKSEKTSDYYADDYYNADDEYADEADEQEKVVHRNPKFISQTTSLLVNEGETIKLPCLADKLGELL